MAADLGPWAPLAPEAAVALLDPLGAPWWVAGGIAIDLFLGRRTREHADLDVALLRRDQAVLDRLAESGWDLRVAAAGVLIPWRAGDRLEGGARHQFWARPNLGAPWAFEILLEEAEGDLWRFRRDASVTLPLGAFGRRPSGGVPFVAPQVALLYKAKAAKEPRNAADFEAAHTALGPAERSWLKRALAMVHEGHPWIARL